MAEIIFKNINESRQPQEGVYRWYFKKSSGEDVTLYIGNAGSRISLVKRSTIARGISEASRTTFSSDSYNGVKYTKLDTDFVVGTCIQYVVEELGMDVIWEHISDDPTREEGYVPKHKPVIQRKDRPILLSELKILRGDGYWRLTAEKKDEAAKEVYKVLKPIMQARLD